MVGTRSSIEESQQRFQNILTENLGPILWTSKLQTQIALSTTEAEYMALSSSMREAIPLMELIEEMRIKNIIEIPKHAKVYCKCLRAFTRVSTHT